MRGVYVKVVSKKGRVKTFRRPVQHIYPLKVRQKYDNRSATDPDADPDEEPSTTVESNNSGRPKRIAAQNAREIV